MQSSQYPNVSVELFKDLLGSVFGHYFNANISSFSHVFSVMMLNQQAAKFIEDHLLFVDENILRTTKNGKFLCDGIASDLFLLNLE